MVERASKSERNLPWMSKDQRDTAPLVIEPCSRSPLPEISGCFRRVQVKRTRREAIPDESTDACARVPLVEYYWLWRGVGGLFTGVKGGEGAWPVDAHGGVACGSPGVLTGSIPDSRLAPRGGGTEVGTL
ncbi:unnamed protein product [Gadus morhua 'NCC']